MSTTTKTLTWSTRNSGADSNIVDSGVRDSKGRACGSSASIELRDWEEKAATPWALQILAHRDGKGFGPSFPKPTWYATMEEAQAAAEKKVAAALKSVARKAAKGVGRQWAKAVSS